MLRRNGIRFPLVRLLQNLRTGAMKYLLLTGATGLVGRYLLRDLLAEDVPVAVLVRSTRFESAAQRIEAIMERWEQLAGRCLPRPVVLEADLREPLLGLAEGSRRWIAENCDRVLHNAASMVFREDKHGEPFRTNVDGMRNMLAVCQETGLRRFHHVSTAYVCGLRNGRVFENELDLGQENGNVYEVSKLAAEKLLRAADFLDPPSVYRPASVAGDSLTGYTTSTHGFYLPLQLAYIMADKVPTALMGEHYFKLLGLEGNEGKNLVPVDWLSAAIVHLVTHPQYHGQTYHLTNPEPVTVSLIQQVISEAIEKFSTKRFVGELTVEEIASYDELFRHYMEIYRSHWRDDPKFDRTNTDRALATLPCPVIDHDMLLRIAGYPVKHNFALKRSEPSQAGWQPQEHLERLVGGEPHSHTHVGGGNAHDPAATTVGLQVTGSGGGQWRLVVRDGNIVGLELGLGPADRARYYLNSSTFSSLVQGRCSVEQSISSGRIVIEGSDSAGGGDQDFVRILETIVSAT
jgi:thioester reductase-like protein